MSNSTLGKTLTFSQETEKLLLVKQKQLVDVTELEALGWYFCSAAWSSNPRPAEGGEKAGSPSPASPSLRITLTSPSLLQQWVRLISLDVWMLACCGRLSAGLALSQNPGPPQEEPSSAHWFQSSSPLVSEHHGCDRITEGDKVHPSNLSEVSRHSPPCGEGLISWSQTLAAGNTSLARGQCAIGVCVLAWRPSSPTGVCLLPHTHLVITVGCV